MEEDSLRILTLRLLKANSTESSEYVFISQFNVEEPETNNKVMSGVYTQQ